MHNCMSKLSTQLKLLQCEYRVGIASKKMPKICPIFSKVTQLYKS